MAMRLLKAGASALDAVEAAIKVLEDKEITNAGFGSNLSIDGVVECDATIVDHLGRSGACGATARKSNDSCFFLSHPACNTTSLPISPCNSWTLLSNVVDRLYFCCRLVLLLSLAYLRLAVCFSKASYVQAHCDLFRGCNGCSANLTIRNQKSNSPCPHHPQPL